MDKKSMFLLTPWSTGFIDNLMVAQLVKNSLHVMGTEGSFPCSQKPYTEANPEPRRPQSTFSPLSKLQITLYIERLI
jgi:hypothetical protein